MAVVSAHGYKIGDYVIVSHPDLPTTDLTYSDGKTFTIVGFTTNLFGRPLVRVVDIERPNGTPTSFYVSELSFEDGTRPTHTINRGAY